MAYETGTATGPTDLLAKLKVFCEAAGWTSNQYASDGAGQRLHLSKAGQFVNLKACVNEAFGPTSNIGYGLCLVGSTGHSAGAAWYAQPGAPTAMVGGNVDVLVATTEAGSITAYHFFADGMAIDAVIEFAPGQYTRLHWGSLTRYASWPGGAYCAASANALNPTAQNSTRYPFFPTGSTQGYPLSHVLADVDGFIGKWVSSGNGSSGKQVRDSYDLLYSVLRDASPNALNGLAVLLPFVVYVLRDGSTVNRSPLGELPTCFFINLKFLTPGQEYTIGGVAYRVFPALQKSASNYGFAVRVA